ncbi:MAG: Gfo/Idh/MocA family oxidoreductase [Candidatus Bipolaricaulota bacterium]|nr:Gfo/Idh/MocA family oxidoreductase [Candidatus Bipolaricaulota bacterium]MBS3791512.1 Gfo/Idh/MocA family oxidoreductase [Candidatus Bipolaricaulota bacterium]
MSDNEVLSYGMVGGGPGSFIGGVHRKAAKFDGEAEIVSGAFSRTYEKTLQTGRELGLDEDRLYEDYKEMAKKEAACDDGIDFVSVVVPNKFHYPIAKEFLNRKINVICDKPLTVTLDEAKELEELTRKNDLLLGVTYVYSGYPMVKQARELIQSGELGEIRVIQGEYPQEWLAAPVEKEGNKQAEWRTDPELSGDANCVGDIGTHIENTVSYISDLEIDSIAANLSIFGKGRELDDNAEMMVKFSSGATGSFWCSQVAVGHDNGLKVRVYGTKGSLVWRQENPNYLEVSYLHKPKEIHSRGRDDLHSSATEAVRLPGGHPEGFYEAFSNIYSSFLAALKDKKQGKDIDPEYYDYPDVTEGVQGVKFIETCLESSDRNSEWVELT